MDTSVMILFLIFVVISLAAGIAFSHLFCVNAYQTAFNPTCFAISMAGIILLAVLKMTLEIVPLISEVVKPELFFVFGLIFFLSAVAGMLLMLPSSLEALQFYYKKTSID
jgi:hypothetical protein